MKHSLSSECVCVSWSMCFCVARFYLSIAVFTVEVADTSCLKIAVAQSSQRAKPALAETDGSESVLLLRNGRILKGHIKTVSTGYLVTSKSGYLAINADEVRFEGKDISEIYLQLRQELKDPSVKEQLGIAEWCVNQHLYQYAERELQGVLKRDPTNEVARRVLKRIEQESEQQEDAASNSKLLTNLNDKTAPDDAARSLGGLSNTTAQQFVGSIQPLLTNKCGNARCHGGEVENDFKLARGATGGGNHRVYAERNLATVLKQVNLAQPTESPLLRVTRGSHAGRPIFTGPGAAVQQKLLTTWVETVATELRGPAGLTGTKLSTTSEYDSVRAGKIERVVEPKVVPVAGVQQPAPIEQVAASTAALRDAPKAQTEPVKRGGDAFDPDEFNTKYSDQTTSRSAKR